jgi:hypothetical protein
MRVTAAYPAHSSCAKVMNACNCTLQRILSIPSIIVEFNLGYAKTSYINQNETQEPLEL